jgi:hypothetical protein
MRMRVVPAILSSLLIACSASAEEAMVCREMYTPPPEFIYEPTDSYKVVEWPDELLQAVCTNGGLPTRPFTIFRGCATKIGEAEWFIYINRDLDEDQKACVLRHEKAHVNGWKHGPRWANYQDESGAYRPAPGPKYRRARTGYPL